MLEIDKIYEGDCLELMPDIPDKSVDMILCDLPYGTTACKWDQVIPFEPLWKEYKRIIKDRGAIVLTASQPFTSALVMSNIEMFKYEWIWRKNRGTSHLNCNKMPLRSHEQILVFYERQPIYNKQYWYDKPYNRGLKTKIELDATNKGAYGLNSGDFITQSQDGKRNPVDVIEFGVVQRTDHPTQKPVALFEYLIKTYTNEGDLVLDNCIGSGTTAIAARNTGRHFIGMEKEPKYVEIARKRIAEIPKKLTAF